ncbi:hypothetical protein VE03_10489 [Pseudogymnoascus sp. 23342-1-I1]|nr:hypothetical protein VE03_10489 [Pseudogymnoascus sp. 23342-1-I1]
MISNNCAWSLIVKERLWEAKYADANSLMALVQHHEALRRLIAQGDRVTRQKLSAANRITTCWGLPISRALRATHGSIWPQDTGRDLLRALAAVAPLCSHDAAIQRFTTDIEGQIAAGRPARTRTWPPVVGVAMVQAYQPELLHRPAPLPRGPRNANAAVQGTPETPIAMAATDVALRRASTRQATTASSCPASSHTCLRLPSS